MSNSVSDEAIPNTAFDCNYFKIKEIGKRSADDKRSVLEYMTNVIIGLYSVDATFSVVFQSVRGELQVYIGTESDNVVALSGLLKGSYGMIDLSDDCSFNHDSIISGHQYRYGGFLLGNPGVSEKESLNNPIDKIVKGMGSNDWIVTVTALPMDKQEVISLHKKWMIEASECSELHEVSFSTTDSRENMSLNKHYSQSDAYYEKVKAFCDKLQEGISVGEWCVTVNYAASNESTSKLLGGLLVSSYYGESSKPETIHAVKQENNFVFSFYGDIKKHSEFLEGKITYPKYATYLSSKELGIISSLPSIDCCGLSVSDFAEFDISRQSEGNLSIGRIVNGGEDSNSEYLIDINELNRHVLICGLTGSGKTNTVKSLLCGIRNNVNGTFPFMVIEPAKKEYWELYKLGFNDLQIYSIGSTETNAHPYCINPFERVTVIDPVSGVSRKVSLQTHIDYVFSAFKASFIMYTPMPYVLETAIYSIYEDYGWDIKNDCNKFGVDEYPTIEDLYDKIPQIVIDMGYDQRMQMDLTGSLQARINSLRIGSKGDTLNVRKSFPVEHIFNGNVVIELDDIGDDDVKAFVISMLMIQLMEYRKQQPDSQLEIKHIMLIEEAHRLLKNVSSGSGEYADPRGAAVDFFCNMLAEMRSKGQGFMIADQIPSKLAPDLIKNTNMKILHRTVVEEDRSLMGGAMHMTDEQIDYVSSLSRGYAAVYSEGDNRPKIVHPLYAGMFTVENNTNVNRDQVLELTSVNCIPVTSDNENVSKIKWPAFCKNCNKICRKNYLDVLKNFNEQAFIEFAEKINPLKTGTFVKSKIDACIDAFISESLSDSSNVDKKEMIQCIIACLIDKWNLINLEPELAFDIFKAYGSYLNS